LCYSWEGQSTNLRSQQNIHSQNSYIVYDLKSTNSSVNNYVHRCQTSKFRAHGIKWFHIILCNILLTLSSASRFLISLRLSVTCSSSSLARPVTSPRLAPLRSSSPLTCKHTGYNTILFHSPTNTRDTTRYSSTHLQTHGIQHDTLYQLKGVLDNYIK